jgi:2-hydroxy-3-keto-5-methylthiopentenyl-1-phosphate phosphatase
MAREADVVFARAELARLCRRETIPWFSLEDFARAWQTLLGHLANSSEV